MGGSYCPHCITGKKERKEGREGGRKGGRKTLSKQGWERRGEGERAHVKSSPYVAAVNTV